MLKNGQEKVVKRKMIESEYRKTGQRRFSDMSVQEQQEANKAQREERQDVIALQQTVGEIRKRLEQAQKEVKSAEGTHTEEIAKQRLEVAKSEMEEAVRNLQQALKDRENAKKRKAIINLLSGSSSTRKIEPSGEQAEQGTVGRDDR